MPNKEQFQLQFFNAENLAPDICFPARRCLVIIAKIRVRAGKMSNLEDTDIACTAQLLTGLASTSVRKTD